VHHNILPLTAHHKPSAKALWDADVRLQGFDDLYVLSREDMLLHTASHLFCSSEFDRGLRDLYDFVRLAREFSKSSEFWPNAVERARELDLIKPLRYALRYASRLLDAAIPTMTAFDDGLPVDNNWLMDAMFTRALMPNHSSAHDNWTPAALFALYVRGHYLRMPLSLLLPHLIYKATLAKIREEEALNDNQKKLEQFRAFLGK
jgi:hypothetical protein